MTDSDREPQEDILKWSIRYVLIPVTLAIMAGYFALAVVDRQFEHQTRLPDNGVFAGVFATMTAAAANAQPTPNLVPTTTATVSPAQTPEANTDAMPIANAATAVPFTPTPRCGSVPLGWQLYTVQPGNTLFSLARQTGTTIATIQQVNCLYGQLIAYSHIWLPNVFVGKPDPTVETTPVVEPVVTSTSTVTEPAPLPDLINGASALVCLDGDNCVPTVSFAVANVGAGKASAFHIQLQFFSKPGAVLDQPVAGLEPGEVQTFTLTSEEMSACYALGCSFCINVDGFNEIAEENEANNQFCPAAEGRG